MTQVQALSRPSDVSLAGGPSFYEGAVTPDSLYLYLSSKLQGLDDQINGVFQRQTKAQEVRGHLNSVQSTLAGLESLVNKDPNKLVTHDVAGNQETFHVQIEDELREIEALDSKLGAELREQFTGKGGILHIDRPAYSVQPENQFSGLQLKASQELVKNKLSDLDAGVQLEMIGLQSTMSARQTAIQLATNLTASLSESLKAIVGNIGR